MEANTKIISQPPLFVAAPATAPVQESRSESLAETDEQITIFKERFNKRVVMAESRQITGCTDKKLGRIGYRPYWVLLFSICLRAVHQVGAALFLASFLLDQKIQLSSLTLAVAFGSGVVLFMTEWMRHRQLFRELSGMISIFKLILLGAAFHGFLPPRAAVLSAFVIASIGAHSPKQLRHRLLY